MTKQFNRVAIVTVGTTGGSGRRIEGLRVTFKIEKSDNPCPNGALVQIYNLAEATRSLFEGKLKTLTLEAGYEGATKTVFSGDIRKVVHKKTGPDLVTEVECGDGEVAIVESRVNKTFPAGTRFDQVFGEVAGSLKGIKNTAQPLSLTGVVTTLKQFVNGYTASGNSKDILSDLTKQVGLGWSVQDGELQVTKVGSPTLDSGVLLSSETGLLESPGKTDTGVSFQCLLNPTLRPGRAVVLKSKSLSGTYRCDKVLHQGDTHGGKWVSLCEATSL